MFARRRLAAILLLPAGVVTSHWLGYLAAHPDQADRAEALGQYHAHLPPLTAIAVPALLAVLVTSARFGGEGRSIGLRLGALVGWQSGAFVVMEVAERVGAGGAVGDALGEPAVWLGLALQFVFASAAIKLVRASAAAGQALVAATRRKRLRLPERNVRFLVGGDEVSPSWLYRSPVSRRGPPLRALS